MNRVVHFEISADNVARAVEFYSKVFDWKIEQWESSEEYWLTIPPIRKRSRNRWSNHKTNTPPWLRHCHHHFGG
jgi:hypothetical protein